MSAHVAWVRWIVRNCRLWGGRDKKNVSELTVDLNFNFNLDFDVYKSGYFRRRFLPNVKKNVPTPPKSTIVSNFGHLSTSNGHCPVELMVTNVSLHYGINNLASFGSRWESPNWCMMTIKMIASYSPLSVHCHWTKDDLNWTTLSWVTASQSLDFFVLVPKR
jgi:hypothetical protein